MKSKNGIVKPGEELEAYVKRFPSQVAAARSMGITRSYLNHMLAGRRGFSDAILEHLGLKRVVTKL